MITTLKIWFYQFVYIIYKLLSIILNLKYDSYETISSKEQIDDKLLDIVSKVNSINIDEEYKKVIISTITYKNIKSLTSEDIKQINRNIDKIIYDISNDEYVVEENKEKIIMQISNIKIEYKSIIEHNCVIENDNLIENNSDDKKYTEKGISSEVLKENSNDKFIKYVISTTDSIKKKEKELKKLKENKKNMKELEYKQELQRIKKELEELEKKYFDLKKDTSYIKIMKYSLDDPYELRYDTVMLKKIINNLNNELNIKEKPIKKEITVKEVKQTEKKPQQEIKKEEQKEVTDLELGNYIIEETSQKFDKYIYNLDKNEHKLNPTNVKKARTTVARKLLDGASTYGVKLFPYHRFKSRLLAITISMFIINNNIRRTRYVIGRKNISLLKTFTLGFNFILNDTIDQINRLRQEMIINGYFDLKILNKLDEIEANITKYKVKKKNKTKILKPINNNH